MEEFLTENQFKDKIIDVAAEYEYFIKRLESINTYNNDFFKETAINDLKLRYIKKIADIGDYEYTNIGIVDIFKSFLFQLGMDDYIIESEIENIKLLKNLDKNKSSNKVKIKEKHI